MSLFARSNYVAQGFGAPAVNGSASDPHTRTRQDSAPFYSFFLVYRLLSVHAMTHPGIWVPFEGGEPS